MIHFFINAKNMSLQAEGLGEQPTSGSCSLLNLRASDFSLVKWTFAGLFGHLKR